MKGEYTRARGRRGGNVGRSLNRIAVAAIEELDETYLVTTLVMAVPLALVSAVGNDKAYNALAGLLYLGLLFPALGIAVVLLYYDQRVRRESYDADALSEDLMR